MVDILDVDACLSQLHLSDTEAAELLSVDTRTIRRWKKNLQEIPGPARAALRAWCRLDTLGLAWQPDAIALGEHDSDRLALQVAAYREHAIALDATLRRVAERGGPAAPWEVNLETRRATLGSMTITFYALSNGGFSPQSYSRRDTRPDLERDRLLLEDGYAAIATAIAKAGKQWQSKSSGR